MSQHYGSSLIPGAQTYDSGALGVLGSVIRANTATGANGPGLIFPCLDDATDDQKEFRLVLKTQPPGTLVLKSGGAFSYSGPGTVISFDLGVNGPIVGTITATLNFKASTAPSGIVSTAAMGAPVLARVQQAGVALSSIGSAEAVGLVSITKSASTGALVTLSGIPTGATFGQPSLNRLAKVSVAPTGVQSSGSVGSPLLAATMPSAGGNSAEVQEMLNWFKLIKSSDGAIVMKGGVLTVITNTAQP